MEETKHYLYRIQPTRHEMLIEGATPEEDEIIGEHFTYLQRLTMEGVAILVGRTLTTDQDTMGIVIFTACSDEEAYAVMNADPAVSKGVMHAKLFPFRIALQAAANDHNALARGADTLVTCGSSQSNHARLTTAAVRKVGIHCAVILSRDRYQEFQGNLLTVYLMGAEVHLVESSDHWNLERQALDFCETLRSQGRTPHYIPVSGTTPHSCLGYVGCGLEIASQISDQGPRLDAFYLPFGTGGIFTGSLLALRDKGITCPLIGISVNRKREQCYESLERWWSELCRLLGVIHISPACPLRSTTTTLAVSTAIYRGVPRRYHPHGSDRGYSPGPSLLREGRFWLSCAPCSWALAIEQQGSSPPFGWHSCTLRLPNRNQGPSQQARYVYRVGRIAANPSKSRIIRVMARYL